MNTKDYSPIKAGLKKGFGLPGVGMGSAMLGFGALAYETNLDIYVGLLSMLFLWSMPAMLIFATLIVSGSSLLLMFFTIFLANVRTLFMVLSAALIMDFKNKNISFFVKLFWAHWVSPTGWTIISTNIDKIKKEDLFTYFKGISIGLVTMCSIGLSIGYYFLEHVSKILIAIPIFFIPLWLIILMLHAKGIFYKTAIFSSGFYLFFLHPYMENLSIIVAGLFSACTGFIFERYFKK